MTMSVHQPNQMNEMSSAEIIRSSDVAQQDVTVTSLPTAKGSNKRSFDVAFLIQPDDKAKQKQMRANKQNTLNLVRYTNDSRENSPENKRSTPEKHSYEHTNPNDYEHRRASPDMKVSKYNLHLQKSFLHETIQQRFMSDHAQRIATAESQRIHTNLNELAVSKYHNQSRYCSTNQQQKVFDDPSIILPEHSHQKSAFTKVNLNQKLIDTRPVVSPNASLSPDLSYQNSLSPSPPILNTFVQKTFQNLLPATTCAGQIFKTGLPGYQSTFPIGENNFHASENQIFHPAAAKSQHLDHFKTQELFASAQKLRPSSNPVAANVLNYRPEIPAMYAAYPFQGLHQAQPVVTQAQDMLKLQVNPAAILNSLLPPSFAALSLPAQNVCAKCNISFRMTSDLVYHMRSHHKGEMATESFKKRREDKLKCPVCAETFRERHHLTRHMTAHQDKEGDVIDEGQQNGVSQNGGSSGSGKRRNVNSSTNGFSNVYCK